MGWGCCHRKHGAHGSTKAPRAAVSLGCQLVTSFTLLIMICLGCSAFHEDFNQSTIHAMIDMLVDKSRTVDGQPTSLKDLGYDMIGIDEGWEVLCTSRLAIPPLAERSATGLAATSSLTIAVDVHRAAVSASTALSTM